MDLKHYRGSMVTRALRGSIVTIAPFSIWLAAKNVVHRGERFMSMSNFMRTQFPVLLPAMRHTEEPAIYLHVQDRDNWQEFHL